MFVRVVHIFVSVEHCVCVCVPLRYAAYNQCLCALPPSLRSSLEIPEINAMALNPAVSQTGTHACTQCVSEAVTSLFTEFGLIPKISTS